MITAIREANPAKSLYIIDCRPYINVMANSITGGGVENGAYEMCKVDFLNIPNMVDVSDAFLLLREAFYLEAKGLSSMAIATRELEWNRVLRLILAGVKKVVTLIAVHNTSTFIHCSDAWDRTAQLCSLAQLCLDPWFRTMEGFGVLVEKEWMRMGHKFQDRTDPDADKRESSPVFLQFLDCVYQLMTQYPTKFEFTEDFLIDLYDEAVYARYGNFLCNHDSERDRLGLSRNTRSVWSKLLGDRKRYVNTLYIDPLRSQQDREGKAKAKAGGRSEGDEVCVPVLDEIFEVSSMGEKMRRMKIVKDEVGHEREVVVEEEGRMDSNADRRDDTILFPKIESYNIVFWTGFYRKYIEGPSSISRPSVHEADDRLYAIRRIKELEAQVSELKKELDEIKRK